MKKQFILFTLVTLQLFFAPQNSFAQSDPRKIMEMVEARNDGDNATADMEMILIDKRGKERKRKIKRFSKDKGEDTFNLMFFLYPADVKNTAFLTYDYDDPQKDDDQWMYLPDLKKTKRIATSDKSGSFMGSDLTYADMTSRNIQEYKYKLLKEGEVRGKKVWIIESIPNKKAQEETGYTKSIFFILKENYFIVRAKHWMKSGNKQKYIDVKKLEKIDGIWIGTKSTITTKRGKEFVHKTVLTFSNVTFGQKLDENLFSIRRLEKGL